ncbi:MAG: hypothetical protein QOC76_5402 [Mycobacterium sp.]|jgi:hypothetical protein|nr:hypothetical protein [Mycobacterium sp.]
MFELLLESTRRQAQLARKFNPHAQGASRGAADANQHACWKTALNLDDAHNEFLSHVWRAEGG